MKREAEVIHSLGADKRGNMHVGTLKSNSQEWVRRLLAGLKWILIITLVAWSVNIAITALFVQFHTYDDEGYVLLSLVNYLKHGALYDVVYTQYGPFFYQLYGGIASLFDFGFTNTTGRYLTAINWILTCILCASIAQRLTRRWVWWPVCFIASFIHLRISADEPMHPGSLTCLLWVFAVWLVVPGKRTTSPVLRGVGLGLLTAVLLLTKINMGVFLVAVVALWMVARVQPDPSRPGITRVFRILRILALPVAIVFPFALMRPLLGELNFLLFASMTALNLGVLHLLARNELVEDAGSSEPTAYVLGTLLACAVIIGVTLAHGTTAIGLLQGVLLDPLHHPSVIFLGLGWVPWALALFAFSATAAGLRRWRPGILADRWFIPSHAILAASLAVGFLALGMQVPFRLFHSLMMPFAWIGAAWLLRGRTQPGDRDAVVFLAFALILGYLQSFPIPGSQFFWGSVLALPLACAVLDEFGCQAAGWLQNRFGAWRPPFQRMAQFGVAVILPLPFVLSLAVFSGTRTDDQGLMLPLGLKGAEQVEQDEGETTALQVLTENASAFGNTLFSLPGMFSFNLWTGLPTPTLSNLTSWWQGLPEEKQDEIRVALDADPKSVVIVNRRVWMFLEDKAYHPSGLLVQHIVDDYPTAFGCFGFEFRVARGRHINPYWVVRLERTAPPSGSGVPIISKMRVRLAPRPGQRVARVELRQIGFKDAMASITVGEPHPTGSYSFKRDDGTEIEDGPVTLQRPVWLTWELPDPSATIQPYKHALWFFDEHDTCIGRAVFNWR